MDGKLKIVFLEDHPIFQRGIRQLLNPFEERYHFECFDHPYNALRFLENAFDTKIKIHLIITDFTQKVPNGYHFASAVRRIEANFTNPVPILLISMLSLTDNPLLPKGLKEGKFTKYLPKNSDPDEISFAVNNLINKYN